MEESLEVDFIDKEQYFYEAVQQWLFAQHRSKTEACKKF